MPLNSLAGVPILPDNKSEKCVVRRTFSFRESDCAALDNVMEEEGRTATWVLSQALRHYAALRDAAKQGGQGK